MESVYVSGASLLAAEGSTDTLSQYLSPTVCRSAGIPRLSPVPKLKASRRREQSMKPYGPPLPGCPNITRPEAALMSDDAKSAVGPA